MKIQIRIIAPREWKKNFLEVELTKRHIPNCYFNNYLEEDLQILVSNKLTPKELIKLKYLKYLIIPTAGTENICIDKLNEANIEIFHNPSILARGVAKYVRANLLKLYGSLNSLKGTQIGFLGNGNITQEIYKKLKCSGANFIAYGRRRIKMELMESVCTKKDLNKLLKSSDIIINTLPRSPETIRLLNKKTPLFKKGSVIVSVSRSGILDEYSILNRVIEGSMRGAILDVYPKEINPKKYTHKGIILTPHIAGIHGKSLKYLADFIENSLKKINRTLSLDHDS